MQHTEKSVFRAAIILCFFLSGLFACEKVPPEPIKIGLSINLSGRGGAAGEHIRDGALLAVREINEKGGINGRSLDLLVRDDKNSEDGIRQADQELIDAGVVAIIGHSYSSNTVTAHPLVTSQNTLLITAYTATTRLSRLDDLFLRTSVDCELYGEKMAAILQKKGIHSIAVLMDMTNPAFVLDYLKYLKAHFDGQIREVRFDSRENAPWPKLIAQLTADSHQGIVLLTEASMTGVALQKLKAEQYSGALFATLWTQTPELFRIAGPAAEGLSIVTFINPENTRPEYLEFSRRMEEYFHKPATARSARAHEMVNILADALQRTQELSASALKAALLSGEYETIMGKVRFNQYGDVDRAVYDVKVKNSKFVNGGEI